MLKNIQLRIRIGHAYNGADGVFSNASFAEAIAALTPSEDEDGASRAQNVYVVGTYIMGHHEDVGTSTKPRLVERKEDEPVFGLEVGIYPPRKNYWSARESERPEYEPAQVNWSALGSSSPDVARFYAQLLTTAAAIADTVNMAL